MASWNRDRPPSRESSQRPSSFVISTPVECMNPLFQGVSARVPRTQEATQPVFVEIEAKMDVNVTRSGRSIPSRFIR